MRSKLTPKLAICAALVAITWAVFGQTIHHQFVNYDDPLYVIENQHIRAGLSWHGIAWAFTHTHSQNWHPLTTISHMLDCQLFGLEPGWHHFINVLLHSAGVIVLFIALHRATGTLWASACAAAIFAIHPLRVESVAWISERKDVLSGLFFLLTLLSYVGYVRQPSTRRYLALLFFFACGLMSKPMVVSLPIVLLLLDYWPLGRLANGETRSSLAKVLVEKVPLFLLAAGSAVATLNAQGGAISDRVQLPVWWRVANGALAYLIYIWQTVWPANLEKIGKFTHSHSALQIKTRGDHTHDARSPQTKGGASGKALGRVFDRSGHCHILNGSGN